LPFKHASGCFAKALLRNTREPEPGNAGGGNADLLDVIFYSFNRASFSVSGNEAFLCNQSNSMKFELMTKDLVNWQGRQEWFFNREHTDTYEQWYEGRYKRAEVWQKK